MCGTAALAANALVEAGHYQPAEMDSMVAPMPPQCTVQDTFCRKRPNLYGSAQVREDHILEELGDTNGNYAGQEDAYTLTDA